ncbi:hypothetical protein [Vibrio viridaestus]|uniref:Uncharacterized protein n=1 Tax=Vibrio viridaestus TaxID=2487322 RepID=A0A3N9TF12_9VIBR|nr:hypothetical protein [Vibrio viridaestus]RQW62620.1 hypothetical protein EES38_12915 [Vibrio viridaestus]
MIDQLLASLRHYADVRQDEIKKGIHSKQFATSLVQSYAESMANALTIVGKDTYINTIQHEADRLCKQIDSDFEAKVSLHKAIDNEHPAFTHFEPKSNAQAKQNNRQRLAG